MRGWALDTGECIKTENVGMLVLFCFILLFAFFKLICLFVYLFANITIPGRVLALGFNGRFVVTAGTTKLIVRDITTWAPLYHIWYPSPSPSPPSHFSPLLPTSYLSSSPQDWTGGMSAGAGYSDHRWLEGRGGVFV